MFKLTMTSEIFVFLTGIITISAGLLACMWAELRRRGAAGHEDAVTEALDFFSRVAVGVGMMIVLVDLIWCVILLAGSLPSSFPRTR